MFIQNFIINIFLQYKSYDKKLKYFQKMFYIVISLWYNLHKYENIYERSFSMSNEELISAYNEVTNFLDFLNKEYEKISE